ncbi:DUF2121 family protein [Methanobacterium alcaliphilum]|uniref:DUF2121 family protein n=1 Tax=Methanobacterium alcaliphilum TaxID=392018 RepID=UPI002009F826|nr:DUF2121 domain-containing protein [Methanobacterium alcaliphilum]MCK9150809.1 DUF2121 domain-containing protein [Methanobacterium alcaliphilum]
MSLIMSYIGQKGCVVAGDKRRIGYFGDKTKREELESELYSGTIKSDEELKKRASELGITLKITDNACKVRSLGDVVVGEVSFKSPFETKRRRIYGTTNGYQIIEITGSNISKMEKGESSIVVFGNKITKDIANKIIKKHWKTKTSLKAIGEIFEEVLAEVAEETPSVSSDHDMFIKHPKLDKREAQELLRETVVRDVKLLQKWREKLQNDLLEKAHTIKLASKILNEGEVGRVVEIDGNHLEIVLKSGVQAYDTKWKPLAKPGEKVLMFTDTPDDVEIGDKVTIENETLGLKRNKSALRCDVILCKTD